MSAEEMSQRGASEMSTLLEFRDQRDEHFARVASIGRPRFGDDLAAGLDLAAFIRREENKLVKREQEQTARLTVDFTENREAKG